MNATQKRLSGKVALVTGGGSGIGRGCALRLAAEGASVVLADIESRGGEDTADEIVHTGGSAHFQATDVRIEDDCQRAAEAAVRQFGGLDVLVNNAGIYPRSTLEDTTEEFWDQMLAINLKGPFFLC